MIKLPTLSIKNLLSNLNYQGGHQCRIINVIIVLENSSYRLYYDRSIINDQTTHNNRPDIVMLDKTIKQAYLIDAAIPTNLTAPSARNYRLERRAHKNIATENGLYNAVSTSHKRFILNKLHESLKLLNLCFGLCILTQKAVILSTCRTVRKLLTGQ